MVCVACFDKSLFETDLKHFEAIVIASFPDKRITAMAPLPDGVANATMVSLCMFNYLVQKYCKLWDSLKYYNRTDATSIEIIYILDFKP